MTQPQMDEQSRNLILAAEISGLLHDLGKLRPEFAEEKMGGLGSSQRRRRFGDPTRRCHQKEAHGAILEEGRAYPPAGEDAWLKEIKQHECWAQILRLPEGWVKIKTIQANGLGDPLRQHHAKATLPLDQFTFLGDLYALGADVRDSALDKGSSGPESGKQKPEYGFIADSFGNEYSDKSYSQKTLREQWSRAEDVINKILLTDKSYQNIPKVRKKLLDAIKPVFLKGLGETRRPTNDVTLWHHSYSAASMFKAAVAEGVLRQDFSHWQDENGLLNISSMGRIRFRLLGIRWDWAALAGGALQPVALTALAESRRVAIDRLRRRLEVKYPVGNLIYEDDSGAIFVVGGFYEGLEDKDGKDSDELFQKYILNPLQAGILQDLDTLGAGVIVRLAWTQPRLYLTDYSEVMAISWLNVSGNRQRFLQVGQAELKELWNKQTSGDYQVQICPQCSLRPGIAQELALNESGLNADDDTGPSGLCNHCQSMVDKRSHEQRRYKAGRLFGMEPHTFNLQKILTKSNTAGNSRVVVLSVKVDVEAIAKSQAMMTQLARPMTDLPELQIINSSSAGKAGDDLENKVLAYLHLGGDEETLCSQISAELAIDARLLVGDDYWLDFQEKKSGPKENDGRIEGPAAEKALQLLDEFFLREFIPDDVGLYRHDGDKLLLFGMRKHASPGRLARTWDDLRALWQQILWDIAGDTQQWLMPLSLDAGGFRVIVAANDVRKALGRIQQRVNERLNKVRAGLDVHVSALAFREKFPLYIALDALRRMERRITTLRAQNWTLRSVLKRKHDGTLASKPEDRVQEVMLDWDTEQGPVQWTVNLRTGDPDQPDLWYPHAICTSRPEGPGRLVRLDQLEPGETIRLRPSTFDFIALDGTARRYDLRYDEQGRRPHLILGEPGRRPYLLEQLGELLDLPRQTGWDISRTKGLLGQIIECYEKWVRDVPTSSRADGREAWRGHCTAIFRRYLKDQPGVRDRLIALLQHEEQICLLFDAFEWSGFIEKDAHSRVEESEPA